MTRRSIHNDWYTAIFKSAIQVSGVQYRYPARKKGHHGRQLNKQNKISIIKAQILGKFCRVGFVLVLSASPPNRNVSVLAHFTCKVVDECMVTGKNYD